MSLQKEPDSHYEAQQLALALQEYIESATAERQAREKYEGHSWGWAGEHYITSRDRAANTFTIKLNEYVDARIRFALRNHQS